MPTRFHLLSAAALAASLAFGCVAAQAQQSASPVPGASPPGAPPPGASSSPAPGTPGAPPSPAPGLGPANGPLPGTAAAGGDPNAKIAVVNGHEIPRMRADVLLHAQPNVQDSPQLRNQVKEQLVSWELIAQEADKKGLSHNPEVVQEMELAREQILLRAFFTDYFHRYPITDAQIKAEYDRLSKSQGGNEYKASHILVKSEDEAKDIIAKLNKGAKFADLAKFSDDPGSKDNGGDLGWSSPATFVKPFGDALTKLKKGETTQVPVQTQYGYHVIRLDDVRPTKAPPLDQVRPRIQQALQQQEAQKIVGELRAKSSIQ